MIRNVTLNNLNRINIFSGINNSGKTSILESIFLLTRQNDATGLFDIIRKRGKSNEIAVTWLNSKFSYTTHCEGTFNNKQCELKLIREFEVDDSFDKSGYLSTIKYSGKAGFGTAVTKSRLFINRDNENSFKRVRIVCNSILSSPYSSNLKNDIINYHEKAVSSGNFDLILKFIHDNIDPNIERIELLGEHKMFVVHHKLFDTPIDLSQFGDGFQRIFQICIEFAYAQNGVICIDELESGIDFRLLEKFIRFIDELSILFNVQVFIASHSKECIDAIIKQATNNTSAYALILNNDNHLNVKFINGLDLSSMIDSSNVDLRRAK